MTHEKTCLASDNFATVHPTIIESDIWTAQAEELICHAFKASPKVLILPNGTAANILALSCPAKDTNP